MRAGRAGTLAAPDSPRRARLASQGEWKTFQLWAATLTYSIASL
ncbi:hypothetical protein MPLDJ20_260098 [Mesorhizobium plurifarium]|uniref:Uncharacterized protein n=1 Tax=Mesorhizobium plurifarium TaxID=69974 RepID=A0A090GMX7_MESPL|nr:hypothetical protein MPLDJ20_260098 [Mesorhizobium plurifarium]